MDWKLVIISLAILAGLYFIFRDTLSMRFPKFFTLKPSDDFGDSDPTHPEPVQYTTPNRTEQRPPPKILKTNCLRQYREMMIRPFAMAAECAATAGGRECVVFFCGEGEEIEQTVVDILQRARWISAVSPGSDYHRAACKPHFNDYIEDLRLRRENAERAGIAVNLDDDDRMTIEFFRAVFIDEWSYFLKKISGAIGNSLGRDATTTEIFHAFMARPGERLDEVRTRTHRRKTTMSLQAVKDNKKSAAAEVATVSETAQPPQQRSETVAMQIVPLTSGTENSTPKGTLVFGGLRAPPPKRPAD
ncbi:MAG: hypothetical protein KAZ30_01965 [Candidatus Magasanikbacteria bacterium]|nr:hypothetical protein [Candidatus Magasanikbacteria bacterium]